MTGILRLGDVFFYRGKSGYNMPWLNSSGGVYVPKLNELWALGFAPFSYFT